MAAFAVRCRPGERTVSADESDRHDSRTRGQPEGRSLRQATRPRWGAVEDHGPHDPRVEPPAGSVWPTVVEQDPPECDACAFQPRCQTSEMFDEVPPAIEDESQVLHRRPDADVNPSYRDVGAFRRPCGHVQRHFGSLTVSPDGRYSLKGFCIFRAVLTDALRHGGGPLALDAQHHIVPDDVVAAVAAHVEIHVLQLVSRRRCGVTEHFVRPMFGIRRKAASRGTEIRWQMNV